VTRNAQPLILVTTHAPGGVARGLSAAGVGYKIVTDRTSAAKAIRTGSVSLVPIRGDMRGSTQTSLISTIDAILTEARVRSTRESTSSSTVVALLDGARRHHLHATLSICLHSIGRYESLITRQSPVALHRIEDVWSLADGCGSLVREANEPATWPAFLEKLSAQVRDLELASDIATKLCAVHGGPRFGNAYIELIKRLDGLLKGTGGLADAEVLTGVPLKRVSNQPARPQLTSYWVGDGSLALSARWSVAFREATFRFAVVPEIEKLALLSVELAHQ